MSKMNWNPDVCTSTVVFGTNMKPELIQNTISALSKLKMDGITKWYVDDVEVHDFSFVNDIGLKQFTVTAVRPAPKQLWCDASVYTVGLKHPDGTVDILPEYKELVEKYGYTEK